jgi:hypothetical protein
MRKIKTIFDRDWKGNRKVTDTPIIDMNILRNAVATEKLDGMNVRVTVRLGIAVRLEKRRNPNKAQKDMGITEPWYVDADPVSPSDKHLFSALENTNLSDIPDGEHSAEALGPKIQGNPLNLDKNTIFFFSIPAEREKITFSDVPLSFEELGEWLKSKASIIGNGLIEGIVWHLPDGDMLKIKAKDFG